MFVLPSPPLRAGESGARLKSLAAAVAEYGMPMARFIVSGTVVAETDAQPIEGIEITLEDEPQAATTNANGDFNLDVNAFGYCFSMASPCAAELTATDVDGPSNGEYDTTTVPISLEQTSPGSGTWDDGTWEAHDVDIEMPAGSSGGASAGGGGAGGGTAGSGTAGAGG